MGECLIIRSGSGTDTSGATATAARVLSGYTCYVNDSKITGTMTNQGTKNASLNAGGSYTIPAGYHNGSGKVTANALSGQTSGTAVAARILSGKTAWVNGSKLTGTMTNRGAISQKLAANGSYTVPVGWHNGSGKVTQSLTTQGAKTVTPTTSNQTACAASRWTTGTITIVGSSTLIASNIKSGVKIFNVTGSYTVLDETTVDWTAFGSSTISLNYTVWHYGNSSWNRNVISTSGTFNYSNAHSLVQLFPWVNYSVTVKLVSGSKRSTFSLEHSFITSTGLRYNTNTVISNANGDGEITKIAKTQSYIGSGSSIFPVGWVRGWFDFPNDTSKTGQLVSFKMWFSKS